MNFCKGESFCNSDLLIKSVLFRRITFAGEISRDDGFIDEEKTGKEKGKVIG